METIEIIPDFTFCITSKNNLRYLKYAVQYIRENCYNKDHKILVFIDADEDGTEEWCKDNDIEYHKNPHKELYGIGNAYNLLVEKATTEFVVIYHADMLAGKDMDLNLYKNWQKGLVVSATRIEPPLHPSDPAKIVENFGLWPEEDVKDGFMKERFNDFVEHNLDNDRTTKGVFAPWLIHREDFLSVGGHDPIMKSHSEDRDLFNRFLLNGFDFIQPWNALVYHLTCRGGQFEHATQTDDLAKKSDDWNNLAFRQTREFIRKWGTTPLYNEYQYPTIIPKYDIALVLENAREDVVGYLEPYFSNIYCDTEIAVDYLASELKLTDIDITQKFKPLDSATYNDIVVKCNCDDLLANQERFKFITMMPMVMQDNNSVGKFKYDVFDISVNKLIEYQNSLVKL